MKIKQNKIAGLIILTLFFLIGFSIGTDPVTVVILSIIGYVVYINIYLGVWNTFLLSSLVYLLIVYRVLLLFIMNALNLDFSFFYTPSIILFVIIIVGFLISKK